MSKVKTPAKRTTKNKNKVRKALGWFKPTTRLKGMLLFALVFAVVGGGILIYKSYAFTWKITIQANTIYYGSIDHCRMEYMGGNYLGGAYTKARVKSITAGKHCQIGIVSVTAKAGGQHTHLPPVSHSTSWSPWYQAYLGPPASFWVGLVRIVNVDAKKYHDVYFMIYYPQVATAR